MIQQHLVVGTQQLSQAKVRQSHASCLNVDKKILQLQIAVNDSDFVDALDDLHDLVENLQRFPFHHLVSADVFLKRDVEAGVIDVHPILARLVGDGVENQSDALAGISRPRWCLRLFIVNVIDEHSVARFNALTLLEVLQQNIFVMHQHFPLNHFLGLFRIVWIVDGENFQLEEFVIFSREVCLNARQWSRCISTYLWSQKKVSYFSSLSADEKKKTKISHFS